MGTVYRGVAADGRKVALKFLSPTLANSPDVVARFAREIEALTRLAHPAIVSVLGHGVEDGIPWFAMPLVEGSDLRARIAAGPLPPAETAAVFGRLFAALDHAHARGVIHRDLKPANVLLAEDGARLADFGIARFEAESLAGTLVTRLTETAAVIGTLPYMSPEQRKGGAIDRRSDLFSAGVMLYEAATGALPQGAFAPPSDGASYGRAEPGTRVRLPPSRSLITSEQTSRSDPGIVKHFSSTSTPIPSALLASGKSRIVRDGCSSSRPASVRRAAAAHCGGAQATCVITLVRVPSAWCTRSSASRFSTWATTPATSVPTPRAAVAVDQIVRARGPQAPAG